MEQRILKRIFCVLIQAPSRALIIFFGAVIRKYTVTGSTDMQRMHDMCHAYVGYEERTIKHNILLRSTALLCCGLPTQLLCKASPQHSNALDLIQEKSLTYQYLLLLVATSKDS